MSTVFFCESLVLWMQSYTVMSAKATNSWHQDKTHAGGSVVIIIVGATYFGHMLWLWLQRFTIWICMTCRPVLHVVTLDCNQAAVSLFIVLHKDRCLVQEQQMIACKVLVCYVIICLSVFFAFLDFNWYFFSNHFWWYVCLIMTACAFWRVYFSVWPLVSSCFITACGSPTYGKIALLSHATDLIRAVLWRHYYVINVQQHNYQNRTATINLRLLQILVTRRSAIAEWPRDASCQ